jgi:hypothetical protein
MRLLASFSLSGLMILGSAKASASTDRPLEWLVAANRNTGKAEDYCFDLRKRLCKCEHLLGSKYTVRYQISAGKVIFADVGRREASAVCASSTMGGIVLRGGVPASSLCAVTTLGRNVELTYVSMEIA